MPKSCLFIIFSFLSIQLNSRPYHTITVDGNLNDWMKDELIIEDRDDSLWFSTPSVCEIQEVYLTWDNENLYIGVHGQVHDKGLLIFIDVNPGTTEGFKDLTKIFSWNRKLFFQNYYPEFMYGSWDHRPGWFYQIVSEYHLKDISHLTKLSADRNPPKSGLPGFELSIPFELLYNQGKGKTTIGAKIAIFATLVTGDLASELVLGTTIQYGYIGGDIAPNDIRTKLMEPTTIYIFCEKVIDENSDGLPDDQQHGIKLEIKSFKISTELFSPPLSNTSFSLELTKPANINIRIFNTSGDLVNHLVKDSYTHSIDLLWDGKDENSFTLPCGIYIVNTRAETPLEKLTINKAVALIR